MAKNIKKIEEQLQICLDMDSPSIVLLNTEIEKHFPSKRNPNYPNAPSLDWDSLKKWAEEKGWKVTLATNNKQIYPGVRFTPLLEINSIPNSAPEPTTGNTKAEQDWYNKPIGSIGIGVVIIIIGAFSVYLIKTHFNLQL